VSPGSSLPLLTERLRLRALRESDLEEFQELYGHPRVQDLIGAHTPEEVEEELRFGIAHQAEHGWSFWAVEQLGDGAFLGVCGVRPLEMRGPEVELGYDLLPDAWGRGVATEAVRATLDYALGPLGMQRVIAVVEPHHRASKRVLEKAGMTRVGERDAYGERNLLYEIRA
jgi:ribosomal-protein-alanine N-acetyltransferase